MQQPEQTRVATLQAGVEPASDDTIPIFVITCDRLTVTQQTIASFYREIAHPIEIVVHDNDSSYPPFLDYLDQLEAQGVRVVGSKKRVAQAEMLNEVRGTVQQ